MEIHLYVSGEILARILVLYFAIRIRTRLRK